MHVLTPDTIVAYLRERGLSEPIRAEMLTGGVSNAVYRVDAAGTMFVVKQSCPQLRTQMAWFSDLDRVFREVEVMQALGEILPEEIVPRVLWVDRENYAFAMSHAPEGPGTWKDEMLAGTVDPARGEQAGRVLGRMHEWSAQHPERMQAFVDATVFCQLRVDPFYRTVRERCPDLAVRLDPLIDDLLHRQIALCHGDFTPKNMLVHDGGFTLVDYETAYFGEPAMDIGLLLAHVVLKAIRQPEQAKAFRDVIQRFWSAYAGELKVLSLADLRERGLQHLAACLLARVDGTSPVHYLDTTGQEKVRALGREILLRQLSTWDTICDGL